MFECFPILLVIVVVDVITTLRQAEVQLYVWMKVLAPTVLLLMVVVSCSVLD